jgi:hypothetical protein
MIAAKSKPMPHSCFIEKTLRCPAGVGWLLWRTVLQGSNYDAEHHENSSGAYYQPIGKIANEAIERSFVDGGLFFL